MTQTTYDEFYRLLYGRTFQIDGWMRAYTTIYGGSVEDCKIEDLQLAYDYLVQFKFDIGHSNGLVKSLGTAIENRDLKNWLSQVGHFVESYPQHLEVLRGDPREMRGFNHLLSKNISLEKLAKSTPGEFSDTMWACAGAERYSSVDLDRLLERVASHFIEEKSEATLREISHLSNWYRTYAEILGVQGTGEDVEVVCKYWTDLCQSDDPPTLRVDGAELFEGYMLGKRMKKYMYSSDNPCEAALREGNLAGWIADMGPKVDLFESRGIDRRFVRTLLANSTDWAIFGLSANELDALERLYRRLWNDISDEGRRSLVAGLNSALREGNVLEWSQHIILALSKKPGVIGGGNYRAIV